MYRKPYASHYTDPHFFDQYYLNQVGSGTGLPVYHGSTRLQRGYGLGGLLGGLFRSAMPLLKKGAMTVGRQALQTGVDIAQDVISGQNVKTAAKRRLKAAGKQLGSKALRKIQTGKGNRNVKKPSQTRGIKRGRNRETVSSKGSKRRRRSPIYDIFG